MNIFRCPKCNETLYGFSSLKKCECGFDVPIHNGVHQFTDDKPISIAGNGLKWLGYENVGENYEPGYCYNKDTEVGIGNSDKLAEFLGSNKIVLDLGAGLGGSSISFSKAGLRVISADISQTMLEVAVTRAKKHNVRKDNIIFVRMNGYKLECADNSIDAVLAIDVLHQVDKPELMMNEIKRVLKDDGFFLQYGNNKSLGFTEEQQIANKRYNEAYKDIEAFYNQLMSDAGYIDPVFKSWEKAVDCIKANFIEYMTIENTGVYGANNMEWSLKLGLHKIKTRASGSKQLIPNDIHNKAWEKTDEYAKNRYGNEYEDITRYYNFTSGIILYKKH